MSQETTRRKRAIISKEVGDQAILLRKQGKTFKEISEITGFKGNSLVEYVKARTDEAYAKRIAIRKEGSVLKSKIDSYSYNEKKRNGNPDKIEEQQLKEAIPVPVDRYFGVEIDYDDDSSVRYSLDHIFAISLGFGSKLENAQVLTRKSNSMKSDFSSREFKVSCYRVVIYDLVSRFMRFTKLEKLIAPHKVVNVIHPSFLPYIKTETRAQQVEQDILDELKEKNLTLDHFGLTLDDLKKALQGRDKLSKVSKIRDELKGS